MARIVRQHRCRQPIDTPSSRERGRTVLRASAPSSLLCTRLAYRSTLRFLWAVLRTLHRRPRHTSAPVVFQALAPSLARGHPNGSQTIVQAELGFSTIYLPLTRDIAEPVPSPSDKAAGLDIGVTHLGMITDGVDALAVAGRGPRSVKRGRAKALARLQK